MKRLFKIYCLLLALVCCFAGLTSCKTQPKDPENTAGADETAEPAIPLSVIADGKTEYIIIYPDGVDPSVEAAAKKLRDELKLKLGVTLKVRSDYINPSMGYVESDREILIGDTNRAASSAVRGGLRRDEYAIRCQKQQLVIAGGSDGKTVEAVDRFIADVVRSAEGSLTVMSDLAILQTHQYALNDFRICGEPAGKYVFVVPSGANEEFMTLARALQGAFADMTGYELAIMTDAKPESKFEILLGDTVRAETAAVAAELTKQDYTIRIQNGKLVFVAGNDERSLAMLREFTARYLTEGGESLILDEKFNMSYHFQYPISQLTLGGKPISEYVIVSDRADNYAANVLKDAVTLITGETLSVVGAAKAGQSECEIILSDAGTDAVKTAAGALAFDEYFIRQNGTKLYLGTNGSDIYSDLSAVIPLIEEHFGFDTETGKAKNTTVALNGVQVVKKSESDRCFLVGDEILAEIEEKRTALKNEIMNSGNLTASGKKTYYVSTAGNDSYDGLSPQTAWASIARVNAQALSEGDCVLFNRGDSWRGTTLMAKSGVTYGAYGSGEKPKIIISPFNGAETGEWVLTDTPNVYKYSIRFSMDVGGLIMNGGEEYGRKVCIEYAADGAYDFKDSFAGIKTPFSSYRDLKNDLDFYHEFAPRTLIDNTGNYGYIYLYSDKGNPADRWQQIEFLDHYHHVQVTANSKTPTVIENISFLYGGLHGVCGGSFQNLIVRYCEFGFVGGCITKYNPDGNPTRLGNAVECYGACNGYTVDHCWIYQVYDAGVTHQSSGATVMMENIAYTNNILEYCTYAIEMWNGNGKIRNVEISGNIILNTGYGFGRDRANQYFAAINRIFPEETEGETVILKNNILAFTAYSLANMGREQNGWYGTWEDNVFVQTRGMSLLADRSWNRMTYDARLTELRSLLNNKFYFYAPDEE